jgi:hypothetical protein
MSGRLNIEAVLQSAVQETLQQIAEEGARELREHVWPNLKETRKAVRGFVSGDTVHIGLYFGRRYSTRNSATYQRFEQWMEDGVMPYLRKRFPEILNDEIKVAGGQSGARQLLLF